MFNLFAGARQFLEQIKKRFVVLAGGEVHAKLAGAIAAQISVELACTNFFRLLGGRRAGEFGMEEASVASEGTTSGGCRRHRHVGHCSRDPMQLLRQIEVIDRAAWVDN